MLKASNWTDSMSSCLQDPGILRHALYGIAIFAIRFPKNRFVHLFLIPLFLLQVDYIILQSLFLKLYNQKMSLILTAVHHSLANVRESFEINLGMGDKQKHCFWIQGFFLPQNSKGETQLSQLLAMPFGF